MQVEDSRYGFEIEAAVRDIAAKGYFLFAGSRKLLGESVTPSSAPATAGGTSDA